MYRYKHINDPLYGGIWLSKLEVELINTKEFQRLRRLKQLSVASYTFPGGDHSRFSHSLGVLFIMGKMCTHLESKCGKRFTKEDTKIMRAAALLHDIGHYPLSHLGEKAYSYYIDNIDNQTKQKKINIVEGLPEDKENKMHSINSVANNKSSSAHHEKLGQIIIKYSNEINTILKKEGLDPDLIGEIIVGEASKVLYCNLMHSACDADRIDYLVRDSYQAGVKFGHVDIDYIISLMRIEDYEVKIPDAPQSQEVIAFDAKGQHVLEHFLMCRYFHYLQVVNNKTVAKFDSITGYLFFKMLEARKFTILGEDIRLLFESRDETVIKEKFLEIDWDRFTDEFFWSNLYDFCKDEDGELETLYNMLIGRIAPSTIYTKKELITVESTIKIAYSEEWYKAIDLMNNKIETFAEKVGIDKNQIVFNKLKTYIHNITESDMDSDPKESAHVLREWIKIVDRNGIRLLVNDENSIIHQASKYASYSIIVYIVVKSTEVSKVELARSEFINYVDATIGEKYD